MSRTWQEQSEEIQRLNDLALEHARNLIEGVTVEQKGTDKEGEPIYTDVADGVDMLARCSTIAKQWMSELRQGKQSEEDEKKPEEEPDDSLVRKARKS